MDRSDEAEPGVAERPSSPQPRRVKVKPDRTGPSRTLIVALILSVIAFAALAVVILNAGEEPVERTDAPDRWDAIEPGEGTLLNLGEGGRAATIIISAQDDVCWTGYIGSAEVEGCGEQQIDVIEAPAVLGANVRHDQTGKAFLGIAMWSDNGNQRLVGDTSRKPLGLVSITGYPPKPQG